MATQLLIITRQLPSATAVKRALEQTGDFEVYPFGDLETAMEFAKANAVDAALVDFDEPDDALAVVQALRRVHPRVILIGKVDEDRDSALALEFGAQGTLDAGYHARDVMNIVNNLLRKRDGIEDEAPEEDEEPKRKTIEFVVLQDAEIDEEDRQRSRALFNKLAAEEPPNPPFEATATIGDLMRGVSETDYLEVLEMLRGVEPGTVPDFDAQPTLADDDTPPTESGVYTVGENTALLILETALDNTVPLDTLSLDQLLASVRSGAEAEPDFLNESGVIEVAVDDEAEDDDSAPDDELFATTQTADTLPSHEELVSRETASIPLQSFTPEGKDVEPPAAADANISQVVEEDELAQADDRQDTPIFQPIEELVATATKALEESAELALPEMPDDLDAEEENTIAQMAVSLTQASLETAAVATLLSRDGQVVAHDGDLTEEDIADLSEVIEGDWEAEESQSRIRFITLGGSGDNYMLYSRRTEEGGFTLSTIFVAKTELTQIRQQTQRLIEALEAFPEQADASETGIVPVAPTQTTSLQPFVPASPLIAFTFLWLVPDDAHRLSGPVQQAVLSGLDIQLREEGWRIDTLDVQAEYVYLHCGVPGDAEPQTIIHELQARAAKIALAQDATLDEATLWADGYMIVSPGRPLSFDEIQQYINFQRM